MKIPSITLLHANVQSKGGKKISLGQGQPNHPKDGDTTNPQEGSNYDFYE